ncbi:hypothetical protein OH77DRAFT_216156 [Trametes cingulata]|nr:hypothetical protein OH77DRAFT_216156 [Trametes cingulata]
MVAVSCDFTQRPMTASPFSRGAFCHSTCEGTNTKFALSVHTVAQSRAHDGVQALHSRAACPDDDEETPDVACGKSQTCFQRLRAFVTAKHHDLGGRAFVPMPPSNLLRVTARRLPLRAARRTCARRMSSSPHQPSRHAQFYTEFAAGMIPVAILGSAVYLGLRTWQQHLAHERFLEEAQAHVQQLEAEVTELRQQLQTAAIEPVTGKDASSSKKSSWWPW